MHERSTVPEKSRSIVEISSRVNGIVRAMLYAFGKWMRTVWDGSSERRCVKRT